MTPTNYARAERWFLWQIPRLGIATRGELAALWTEREEAAGFPAERSQVGVVVDKGLRRLIHKGLAEKYRPPGWDTRKPLPYRLTTAGEVELERRELATLQNDRSSSGEPLPPLHRPA